VHEALYRVQDDPGEARDRLAAEGARAEGLRARLAASIGARRPLAEAPPAPRVESEEAERLRALGYH
jgi:hypothetical protein